MTDHKCSYDSDCSQDQTCERYPSMDNLQATDGRSEWSSRDTPNGNGDYELSRDAAAAGVTCPVPTTFGCRRKIRRQGLPQDR